jgi:DNA-binding CsgD family transcriptional regulator
VTISELHAERQVVLDAAAELQLRRSAIVRALVAGESTPQVRVVAREPDLNAQLMAESRRWRHLLSIRQCTTGPEIRASLPNNRRCLAVGLNMTSLLDWDGTTPAARALLQREPAGVYYYVWAPLNLKIIDMTEALLQGPAENGCSTLIAVRTPAVLRAALNYWKAVLATARPAWIHSSDVMGSGAGQFTSRQRRILEMLSQDMTDQNIADALGVSLRTVRYDVAGILDALGVTSRFAAGLHLGMTERDPMPWTPRASHGDLTAAHR